MLGRADAGDRSRVDGLQGIGGVGLRHPTGVVDDQHRLGVARVPQITGQLVQRVEHRRVQEGIHDGGRGAHVLALATGHLTAQQHRDGAQLVSGVLVQDDLQDSFLVGRVLGGVGQRHDDRLGALVDKLTNLLAHVVIHDGHQHLAHRVDPFLDRADQLARHQWLRSLGIGHVALPDGVQPLAVPTPAGERDRVLKTVGHQSCDPRALALDQGVGPKVVA